MKVDVLNHVHSALEHRKGTKTCEVLKIIQGMISAMRDEEVISVSMPVNRRLTDLAGKLSQEITELNQKVVLPAVVKNIKEMLRDSA